jgi:hypothetical protein
VDQVQRTHWKQDYLFGRHLNYGKLAQAATRIREFEDDAVNFEIRGQLGQHFRRFRQIDLRDSKANAVANLGTATGIHIDCPCLSLWQFSGQKTDQDEFVTEKERNDRIVFRNQQVAVRSKPQWNPSRECMASQLSARSSSEIR